MSIISRRYFALSGEVNEDNYEAGRLFIDGQEFGDVLTGLHREAFAFVADTDRPVAITFTVEAGPTNVVDGQEFSGIARFIGIPLDNGEARARYAKTNRKTRKVSDVIAPVMQNGPGWTRRLVHDRITDCNPSGSGRSATGCTWRQRGWLKAARRR